MQDVLIKLDANSLYDLQIDSGDFAPANGFGTLIPVSYFTDARAPVALVQDARRQRGWVADAEIGGLLWLLDQARITQDVLNLAAVYAKESLQFTVDDGLVTDIAVSVKQEGLSTINITTVITTIDNQTQQYVSVWKETTI